MSGRARLPASAPLKASQRGRCRAAPSRVSVIPVWRTGDKVRWRDRIGDFQRDVGDGEHAEIMIADRTYRVRLEEACLRPIRGLRAAGVSLLTRSASRFRCR